MQILSTARTDNFGGDWAPSQAHRGAVLASDGRIFCIPRNNSFFTIINQDGSVVFDHLGLEGVALNTSGGALGGDGKIYSPPRDSQFVLVIDPATNTATTETLGVQFGTQENKWTGAAAGDNGKIYCAPSIANTCLVIDTTTSPATAYTTNFGLSWNAGGGTVHHLMWVGAVKVPDGRIFCIPYNAGACLVIDPDTDTATLEGFGGLFPQGVGENRWNDAAVGVDGKIYCAPRDAGDVLVIDPVAMTATRTDYGLDLSGVNRWARAFALRDGKIYMPPTGAVDILVIDPLEGSAERWSPFDMSGMSGPRWIGGAVHSNGSLYAPPQSSQTFLIIDPPVMLTTAVAGISSGRREIEVRGVNSEGNGPWSNVAEVDIGPKIEVAYLGSAPVTKMYIGTQEVVSLK